jgi:MoaA/NifB/PqqE/SkfB family radical SAM enzyme
LNRRETTLSGILLGQPLTGPETVHIDIVNACNTDCITCWDHSPLLDSPRATAWKRKRASLENIAELLDNLNDLGGLRSVIISGMGEPFVHPQIYDIVENIKRRDLFLTIITNLVLADPERVVALGIDQLLIGIHGASRESYEAFHPSFRNGEWEKLHTQLEYFSKAGKRFKHVHVICQTNAHELAAMIRQAHDLSAGAVNFKLASLLEGTERCAISEAQREDLLSRQIPEARAAASTLGVESNLDVFERQLLAGGHETAPIEETGCFMGYAYSRITVEGDVLYCCNTEIKVGSLRDGLAFSDLWRGASWQALRERLRAGSYFPGCSQCGKYNQNVALAAAFERHFGRVRLLEVTGRA